MATAAAVLFAQPAPRAMLLVTDGKSTANRIRMEDAARVLARRGVTLLVDYEPEWQGSGRLNPYLDSDGPMRQLAEWTGGMLRVDDSFSRPALWKTPPPPFAPLLQALRTSYTLYVPLAGDADTLHQIEVRVTRPGLRVHAPRWSAAAAGP